MTHFLCTVLAMLGLDTFQPKELIYLPMAVKVNPANQILVLDQSESTILAFDENGNLAFRIGAPGQGPGEFNNPTDFDMFSDGRIIVVDSGNRRLQVFDPVGTYQNMIRIDDHAIGQILVLNKDQFILTESNGWSFSITMGAGDQERKRFHKYDRDGKYLHSLGEFISHKNPLLAVRLNQGPLVRVGEKFLFASSCSNELIWYDGHREKKFKYPLPFIPDDPEEKMISGEEGGEQVYSMAVKSDFVCLGMDVLDNGDIVLLRTKGHTVISEGLPITNLVRLAPDGTLRKKYPGEYQSRGIAASNDDRYLYIILEEEEGGLRRIKL